MNHTFVWVWPVMECSVFICRHENGSVKFWDITDGKFHTDMFKVCMN